MLSYGNFTFGMSSGGGGSATWGEIEGTLSAQTDLQSALDGKASSSDIATAINNITDILSKPTPNEITSTLNNNSTPSTVDIIDSNSLSLAGQNLISSVNGIETSPLALPIVGVNGSENQINVRVENGVATLSANDIFNVNALLLNGNAGTFWSLKSGGTFSNTLIQTTLNKNTAFTLPNADSNPIQPLATATANQFLQYIDNQGVQHLANSINTNVLALDTNALTLTINGVASNSVSIQALITSPTDNNIVTMNSLGQVINSGFKFNTINPFDNPSASETTSNLNFYNFVTSVTNGSKGLQPVKLILTTNQALSGFPTQGGYTCVEGDRVLCIAQTNTAQNLVYVVHTGAWTVASDSLTVSQLIGAWCPADKGSYSENYVYIVSVTPPSGAVTPTAVEWSTPVNAGLYQNGTGILLTGSVFSIANTTVTSGDYNINGQALFTVNPQGQLTASSNVNLAISNLSDVTTTSPILNNVLTFNGEKWINSTRVNLSTNVAGGVLGSLLYQTGSDTTGTVAPNTTTGLQFLTQLGNGTISASPSWKTLTFSDIGGKITNLQLPDLASANILVGSSSNIATPVTLSGDGTLSNAGALSISNNAITNAKLSTMATMTLKGNNAGATGSPNDLSVLQVNTMLGINTNIQYVTPNGSDTNNGFTPNTGVATLSQALINLGNTAGTIVIAPKVGGYTEPAVNVISQNITIMGLTKNQAIQFTNPVTFSHTASNVQVSDIGFTTLIHSGAGGLYIRGGSVTTSLSKTGNGYLQVQGTDLQASTTTVSITGTGAVTLTDSTVLGATTINNASAVVSIMKCLNSKAITLTAGVLGIEATTVYSTSAGTNALTVASGSFLFATNSSFMVTGTTNQALVSVASGGFYSFIDSPYSASSTILGTMFTRTANFDAIALATALPISSGGTGQTTANASFNALVPAQTGNAGKVLGTDGTNTSWVNSGSGGSSTPVNMFSSNASASNQTALQTITNSASSTAWKTPAPTTNRITINNNVTGTAGFTVGTNTIIFNVAGTYEINFVVNLANSANLGSNVQLYTQLIQNGAFICIGQDQPGNVNNYCINVITAQITCASGDVIDFRANSGSGTPDVAINSYMLSIKLISSPSTTASSTPTANTVVQWDNNLNLSANNLNLLSNSTLTSAGTTTLTVASSSIQKFTGTLSHTVRFPNATTLEVGATYTIINSTTGSAGYILVENSSGTDLITILPSPTGNSNTFMLTDNSSVAGVWEYRKEIKGRFTLNQPFVIGRLNMQVTLTNGNGLQVKSISGTITGTAWGYSIRGGGRGDNNNTDNNVSITSGAFIQLFGITNFVDNNTQNVTITDTGNGGIYNVVNLSVRGSVNVIHVTYAN